MKKRDEEIYNKFSFCGVNRKGRFVMKVFIDSYDKYYLYICF